MCLVGVSPTYAFDYLEHSLFTDRACYAAQRILAENVAAGGVREKSRYLALALVCPQKWQPTYCKSGKKNFDGQMRFNGKHTATLGDYSALVDHITEYGKIKSLPNAKDRGFVDLLWKSFLPDAGTGVAGAIAQKGCDIDEDPHWYEIENDVAAFFGVWDAEKRSLKLDTSLLSEDKRAPLSPGPVDPSTLFTIKNPRFLDLQLFNQNHFGKNAYRTWAGMHYPALQVSAAKCEDTVDLDDSVAEDLAEDLPQFQNIDWDSDDNPTYAEDSCRLLREVLRRRLVEWHKRGERSLVEPVLPLLSLLENNPTSPEAHQVLMELPSNVAALALEGGGLHYMQDALSGGHIRTEHTGRSLSVTRRYHDIDSKNGVFVAFATRENQFEFVAYGDTYLLGKTERVKGESHLENCEDIPQGLRPSPARVSRCLLGYQRGMLTAVNAASLVDWNLGGILYRDASVLSKEDSPTGCPEKSSAASFICAYLPLQAFTAPPVVAVHGMGYLGREGLPPTPPPIDFQSLRIESFLDAAGNGTQLGARLEFLTPFTRSAGDWLYSYDFGFLMTLGELKRQQLKHEFAFTFHYRLATRFLINAGPLTYMGFEGFSSQTNFFFGIGLGGGITILPEGWTKIPLELTLSYRAPWRFIDTEHGFRGQRMEAHWVGLSIGLAFL
ncbi:MAG TPA: hypothetical protein PLY93_01165 [Turneriella sp.]|nr:hypothetical protein [Turneriella sp.]